MNKELEALERIKNIPILSTPESTQKIFYDKHKKELDIIEAALKNYQDLTEYIDTLQGDRDYWYNIAIENEKKLKALEIIKEKGLDIREFRYAFSLYEYNICKNIGCKELTQEEYDLLKEVLL